MANGPNESFINLLEQTKSTTQIHATTEHCHGVTGPKSCPSLNDLNKTAVTSLTVHMAASYNLSIPNLSTRLSITAP